jgi:predicted MFS family arabinose efflux permease
MVALFITVPRVKPKEAARSKYSDELLDGMRFLIRDRLILAIVATVMITNFLDSAFGGVIQPVFVKQVYGSALDLGLIIAANGGGAVLGAIIFGAVQYERIPPDMRGRVFGTITAGAWAAMPLGILLGGILTEQFGVRPLLIALGFTYLATTCSMAVIPAMHEMNRRVGERLQT